MGGLTQLNNSASQNLLAKTMNVCVFAKDTGSAGALSEIVWALREQEGVNVVVFTDEPSPTALAYATFLAQNIYPRTPFDYKMKGELTREMINHVIDAERPQIILGGISSDDGADRFAFEAGLRLNIKTAAVIESRPHAWLNYYGLRDIPFYSRLDALFVPDEISRDYLINLEFQPERVFALGNPAWESKYKARRKRKKLRALGRQRFGIDDDTVLIVYAVTNDLDDRDIDNPNHVDYYAGSEKWALFEFLQSLRDVQQMGAKIMGVVRQKPGLNDRAPFIRGMIDLVCPGVEFDVERIFKGELAANSTLCAADVVVGYDTLAVSDAAVLGTPGIYFMPHLLLSCKNDPQAAFNEPRNTIPFHEPLMLLDFMHEVACVPRAALKRLHSRIVPIEIVHKAAHNIAKKIMAMVSSKRSRN
ncbi:MAG: hypothetical protein A3H57_02860 [Candidatus Taylorbacteria bacterium RIFCSPLOWO2_02_FULL_43_11]|uniref:Lipid-A-disaccharide synthase n=1 Tax=Candidatus Taylorbacteria bacterium RIFCSPHIGHO2_02_FULL_43_32b TaxID=1802306 RepID=A0A1G2MIB5_9BACT|nr:MAG: hypothetical protein A3C72_01625 [Candidatus Taylorbacteria bacterium RIFCSPHIGHO2_02_FULL_43_32b]OHA30595.1 MAG: hypothetical protein A3B08_04490 [Candidatus Taylorbacteria bacterium RIFCSPLOWO2_01_FULL_43_44]OHA36518.1 MAG: hypothetical protein A3H57_02860 [Candidatus Taylorbacteria bacterium RIFCSPLOWO2_02_FULL_43_11]